ncbi:hypothetical protein PISMIDRAFT_676502 [Pisolithus microcarpus 441]|uniref:Uncharacterized protein n=1 Tax=Pisolithus microcarpus 441 TaxID=765257 RepID=A0A0C9YLY9_9AGAM|nr:hypothetical protein PISMIDRAFT_676502 [Pisolithus microcarpus 441]
MWRSAHALFRTLAPIRAKFATRDLRWPRRLSSVPVHQRQLSPVSQAFTAISVVTSIQDKRTIALAR